MGLFRHTVSQGNRLAQRAVLLGLATLLLTLALPGDAFIPIAPELVKLPGGIQVPASLVYEATALANATLLLDDGRYLEVGSYSPLNVTPPTVTSSNWIGYAWAKAECVYYPELGYPICDYFYKAFTGYWNIPSAPTDPNNVLLYIFNGMQSYSASSYPLLQPVLQWGNNGAFGGWYWSMASWYIASSSEYVYSTPMLDVGTYYVDAHGGIGWLYGKTYQITSTVLNSACRSGYYSCPDTSLTVGTGHSVFGFISVVLEGYWFNGWNWDNLDNCNQLPGDIHFTSLRVVGLLKLSQISVETNTFSHLPPHSIYSWSSICTGSQG